MKRECERTRKLLPDYLRGHVLRSTRKRIERHVASCVVCHSELDSLRRVEETRQLLTDLHAAEGVAHRLSGAMAMLGGLKKLIYRPLLACLILLVFAALYYYALMPRQIDIDIDSIVNAPRASLAPPAPAPPAETHKTAEKAPETGHVRTAVVSTIAATPGGGTAEPFRVAIVPANEAAVRQINDVLRGHGTLSRHQFGDTEREIAGNLTTTDLITLFNRISPFAKVTYNKKRLEFLPSAQQVPVVLSLTAVPKASALPAPLSKPVSTPTGTAASDAGVSKGTATTAPPAAAAP